MARRHACSPGPVSGNEYGRRRIGRVDDDGVGALLRISKVLRLRRTLAEGTFAKGSHPEDEDRISDGPWGKSRGRASERRWLRLSARFSRGR